MCATRPEPSSSRASRCSVTPPRRAPRHHLLPGAATAGAITQTLLGVLACGANSPAKAIPDRVVVVAPALVPDDPDPDRAGEVEPPVGQPPEGMIAVGGALCVLGSAETAPAWPPHEERLPRFYLDATEVTVEAYRRCVDAQACTAPKVSDACAEGAGQGAGRPQNCVSWHQAGTYCVWLGKRLPTEEEWECAARGSAGRRYPWGDEEPTRNHLCTSRTAACPAGAFPLGATPEGVQDLAGNLWEWTATAYVEDKPSYSGAEVASIWVLRGGGWNQRVPLSIAAWDRGGVGADVQHAAVGFRCAL